VSILHRLRDIVIYFEKLNEVTWPWTHPFRGIIYHACSNTLLHSINQRTTSPIPKLQFKQEAQLPQRDRATRHVSRFCYVSRSWELDRFQTAKVAFNPNPNANSLKDIGNGDIRQATCDFLLVLFSTMSIVHL